MKIKAAQPGAAATSARAEGRARRKRRSRLRFIAPVLGVLLGGVLATPVQAQFYPPPPPLPAVEEEEEEGFGFGDEGEQQQQRKGSPLRRWLADAGLDFSESTPRMQLNALQLYANIGGKLHPFYVFTSVPLVAPERNDLQEYYAHALLDQYGGLLNVSLAPRWCLLSAESETQRTAAEQRGLDMCQRDHHLQLQAQAGAKVIEVVGAETNDFAPAAQVGFDASFQLDLQGSETLDPEARQGMLVLRASGFADAVFGPTYNDMFSVGDDRASPVPVVGTAELQFFIFDYVYFTAGYSVATEDRIGDRWYFSLSRNRSFFGDQE